MRVVDQEMRIAESTEWLTLTLNVNGQEHDVRARAHHTLLDVLRNQVGLIDTREGCGIGMCGACTVLVDGRIVSGCLVLAAQAEGREIVTVEGLVGESGELHPIQDAYIEHTGFQCSYCTPGFVLATKALLDEQPHAGPRRREGVPGRQSLPLRQLREDPRRGDGRTRTRRVRCVAQWRRSGRSRATEGNLKATSGNGARAPAAG